MLQNLRKVPNQITALRLCLIPILWGIAIWDRPAIVGLGLILAFITDIADGMAARMLGQVSDFGSKFDSLADNLLYPSAVAWLALLKPNIFTQHLFVILAAISIQAASKIVGLVKFRRFKDSSE